MGISILPWPISGKLPYFYRNDSPQSPVRFWDCGYGTRPLQTKQAPMRVGFPAIGAVATVHLPNGQELVGRVDGGNGHSGARSPEIHFGLGEIKGDVQLPVDVEWRDTDGQTHRETLHLSPGRHSVMLGEESLSFPQVS